MERLLIIFIIATVTSSASAVRCYVCNSHNVTECKDIAPGSKNKYLIDCETIMDGHKYTLCRKIEMSLDMDFGKLHPAERRIHRACGYLKDDMMDRECYYKSGYNTRSWVCSCSKDDCNGSYTVGPLALGIIVSLGCSLVAMIKSSTRV